LDFRFIRDFNVLIINIFSNNKKKEGGVRNFFLIDAGSG